MLGKVALMQKSKCRMSTSRLKNAAHFKGKPLPFYEKLCTIFGKDRATASHALNLGEEDTAEETPTSPVEVDMDIPLSGGAAGGASNKRKRSKSDDFNEIFKECSSDLTERIEHSIGSLGEKIVASAHETIAGDILEEVITEIQNLPGISAHQRLKRMDIIGCNTSKANIFLQSSLYPNACERCHRLEVCPETRILNFLHVTPETC